MKLLMTRLVTSNQQKVCGIKMRTGWARVWRQPFRAKPPTGLALENPSLQGREPHQFIFFFFFVLFSISQIVHYEHLLLFKDLCCEGTYTLENEKSMAEYTLIYKSVVFFKLFKMCYYVKWDTQDSGEGLSRFSALRFILCLPFLWPGECL